MKAVTPQQQKVYDFLFEQFSTGRIPTVREVANHFNYQVNAAHQHMKALETKGLIIRNHESRGLKLVGYRLILVQE